LRGAECQGNGDQAPILCVQAHVVSHSLFYLPLAFAFSSPGRELQQNRSAMPVA
jgi:hypothetical protein